MIKGAWLSDDRLYRYSLWRIWEPNKPYVVFVGLNPSTADELVDDRTISRCISFARDWGYGGLYMLNLFAFRATKPQVMKQAADPIGPDNDNYLIDICSGGWYSYCSLGSGRRFSMPRCPCAAYPTQPASPGTD